MALPSRQPALRIVALVLALGTATCGDRTGLVSVSTAGADAATPSRASNVPPAPSCLAPAPSPIVVYTAPDGVTVGDLAIDATSIYFTNPFGEGDITRIDKCGGPSAVIASSNNPDGTARSIAATGSMVAWLDLIGLGGQVSSVPTAPGRSSRVILSDDGSCLAGCLADTIAVDAEYAYVSGSAGLTRAPLAGGPPATLGPDGGYVLVVDDTHVYYIESPPIGSALRSVPKAGGASSVLVSSAGGDLAQDDDYLYWDDWDGTTGSIMRVPKTGGQPSEVAHSLMGPGSLAVDDRYVYWTAGSDPGTRYVMRASKTGGSAITTLYSGTVGDEHSLVVDERSVYWSAVHALMRVDK